MSHPTTSDTDRFGSLTTKGFWLAGAYNVVGILIASKFFTNPLLPALDPVVFSWVGTVAIILWGLAYWSVAKSFRSVPYLVLVFFVEKLVYTAAWVRWLMHHSDTLPLLYSESPLTAAFFVGYGAGDFAFGLFFLWVGSRALRLRRRE